MCISIIGEWRKGEKKGGVKRGRVLTRLELLVGCGTYGVWVVYMLGYWGIGLGWEGEEMKEIEGGKGRRRG